MPRYVINTQQHFGGDWIATFDSYDGTPDATDRDSLMGRAATEVDAIADLITEADALEGE